MTSYAVAMHEDLDFSSYLYATLQKHKYEVISEALLNKSEKTIIFISLRSGAWCSIAVVSNSTNLPISLGFIWEQV
jgi:hypothetical protein